MLAAMLFLLRREYRERYPSAWAFFGEGFGLLASLTVYWFTAKAFAPRFDTGASGYFHYLIIGETTLFVPLVLFQGLARSFRQAVATGTLDAMLAQPVSPFRVMMMMGSSLIPLELARIFATLLLAKVLFGFDLDPTLLGGVFFLQLVSLPAFLGLGMLAVAALLVFGRGDAILSYLGGAAAILAGAYFPVAVLPGSLQELAAVASPFSVLLEGTRNFLASGYGAGHFVHTATVLLAWSVLSFRLGVVFMNLGFARARKKGSALLLA